MKKKRKFYKKKKNIKNDKELPKNSRLFTDKIINDHTVFLFGFIIIIFAISIVGIELYKSLKTQEIILENRKQVVDELNYWNREVVEKPKYRDGYFNLALIYYRLGDELNSMENLEKALRLDPNFLEGKKLKILLEEE